MGDGYDDLGMVLYETDGAIARIVLNWPEKANAQSSEMVWQVDEALDLAEHDYDDQGRDLQGQRQGLLRRARDRAVPTPTPSSPRSIEAIGKNWIGSRDLFLWPTLRFYEFPKPMIAQVHGYCLGGGTYWAYLPDITIASDDAYFQMPLVQGLGLPRRRDDGRAVDVHEPQACRRVPLHGAHADRRGGRAVRADQQGRARATQLDEAVEAMAATSPGPRSRRLMGTKSLLMRAWEQMGMRQHLQMSADVMSIMEKTSDAQSGPPAYGGGRTEAARPDRRLTASAAARSGGKA